MKTRMEEWLEENRVRYSGEKWLAGYYWYGEPLERFIQAGKVAALQQTAPRQYRSEAIEQFSFAVLTTETVNALLPHGPFLELGCGTGYWAYELMRAGANSTRTIIPTDPHPYDGLSVRPREQYIPVDPITAEEALRKYANEMPKRTLLLVWPSYDEPWAAEALRDYRARGGRKVVYVGEWGGCTADDTFHDCLENEWQEVEELPLRSWQYIRDHCWVYTPKEIT